MITTTNKRPSGPFFSTEEETARGNVRIEADTYIEEDVLEFIRTLMNGNESARDISIKLLAKTKPYGIKTTQIVKSGENWVITFSQKEEWELS